RVTERLGDKRIITFGEAEGADVRVTSIADVGPVSFDIAWRGESFAAQLAVPGRHNAINAAGPFAVLVGLGFDAEQSLRGLERFVGVGRRFEFHGDIRGVRVYDDYARHPTDVEAALQTARSVVGAGRVIAVHQPDLYSGTQLMAGEFAAVYE